MKNFASPHCHIQSLDSASTPDAFAERELELQTGAITCTDHGTMGACRETYQLAKDNKLIPILGLEGYVRDDDCSILAAGGINKDEKGTYSKYNKYYHITMHALDQAGYEAMVQELSKADYRAEQHGSERKPLFTWEQLERLGGYNITMTSGCLIGMVQRHLLADRPDLAIKYYERLRSIPKAGNFYVELFPHRCDTYWVSGVFITLEGGEKFKYWKQKKIKTTLFEDVTVEDLAKAALRGKPVGKLVAVMNNRKWEEREPREIVEVKLVEDFLQNECKPWCPDGDVQLGANKFMLHMAQTRGDKLLISDDAHFATPDEKIVQDSRLGGAGGSWKFANSYHRQTGVEAYEYFKSAMGMTERDFEALLESNSEWSQRFKNFSFKDRKSLPTSFYPKDTLAHLHQLIAKHGRMDWNNKTWVARLEKEIDLLHCNGTIDLLPYFFLAEEVCYLYEQHGELTGPGRGSAAGMSVAYLLGITHVDPHRYGLSEDRFLTKDRIEDGKLPDIDMDFPDRDLLTNVKTGWLYKRFGPNVAAVSTNTMLRLKSSIKDVHRSLHGRVDAEIEALCKKLPNPPQGIDDADFIFGYEGDDGKEVRGLLFESKDLQAYTNKYPHEWAIVRKMLGIARQKSRHACAYVIADEPISNFIPLTTINDVRTTQYTAPWVEAAGGLKMDFLGLNSLKDLGAALKIIQGRNGGVVTKDHVIDGKRVPGFRLVPIGGRYYDVWDLPDDQSVFNDIAESKTETVFQLNTNSAKQWLRQFNYEKAPGIKAIDSIEAISAFTALDRPGPLDARVRDPISGREHNMLVEYANRAKGYAATDPIKALNGLLPETYGVMVYQEQLQKIYQYLTDCTGIEANTFRTNVAKKKMEKVLKAYPNFMEKAAAKIGKADAEKVWEQTVTFGQYGFNKSHSICYSVIAYACAFLKRHFPVEWWCAVLRNADKKEITEKFWKHSKQWVDLPDVAKSGDVFEIQSNRIRAPLSFINGVGPGAHDQLCAGRPFLSIHDFTSKIAKHIAAGTRPVMDGSGQQAVDAKGKPKYKAGTSALNRGVVGRLIVAGVMDSLFPPEAAHMNDKFMLYETSLADAKSALTGKKVKPGKVAEQFILMSALTRYQMRKNVLPVYTEPLMPLIENLGVEGLVKLRDGNHCYLPETQETIRSVKTQMGVGADYTLERLPVVNGQQLKFYNEDYEIQAGQHVTLVTPAYVVAERRFSYQNGTKQAVDLTLDVDGEHFSFVKWPDRDTGKLNCPTNLAGSVCLVMCSRYKLDRPFAIDALVVIAPPLSDEKSETSPE
jgi:DNA-directed DNA polymerase III PolC